MVPGLEALLAAALERERLLSDVVETAALRRSDVLKTALRLRLARPALAATAILTAAEALDSPGATDAERVELTEDIRSEARAAVPADRQPARPLAPRGGGRRPAVEWCAVDEILEAAIAGLEAPAGTFTGVVDADLPPIRADAAQLERALANLLENGARHAGGHPVSVRARDVGSRILVRIVDRGPGVPPAQAERIFEPFYRSGDARAGAAAPAWGSRSPAVHRGQRRPVAVESLPGQSTTFVVELPLAPVPAEVAR